MYCGCVFVCVHVHVCVCVWEREQAHLSPERWRERWFFQTEILPVCMCPWEYAHPLPYFLTDDAAQKEERGNIPQCHTAHPLEWVDGWMDEGWMCRWMGRHRRINVKVDGNSIKWKLNVSVVATLTAFSIFERLSCSQRIKYSTSGFVLENKSLGMLLFINSFFFGKCPTSTWTVPCCEHYCLAKTNGPMETDLPCTFIYYIPSCKSIEMSMSQVWLSIVIKNQITCVKDSGIQNEYMA